MKECGKSEEENCKETQKLEEYAGTPLHLDSLVIKPNKLEGKNNVMQPKERNATKCNGCQL